MFVRIRFFLMLLVVLIGARGAAQTSQPAPSAWGDTVSAIAAILIADDPALTSPLENFIPDTATVARFGDGDAETRAHLQQDCSGLIIVTQRGYAAAAETVASDLGADVQNCEPMPDTLRRQFTPRDEIEAKRANMIARQWIDSVLHPAEDECVGLIVLWEKPPPITASVLIGAAPSKTAKQPILILIKAKKLADQQYQVTQVVYGDAKQAIN